MADMATPSAASIGTSDPPPTTVKSKQQFVKPEKPDEEKYKKDIEKAEKAHSIAQEKLNALKAKIDVAKPSSKDSPSSKRRAELISQLQAIRQTQQGNKSSRGAVLDKIRKLDEQLKSRINELKNARSRVPYKTSADVDREIERLQKQVDTGTMKIVDEKRALSEITSLHKQKKGFAGFDEQEKGIADIKAQIAEQKKALDDPEQKALSEKYTELQKELDVLKAEQDDAFKNLNSLRDERTKSQLEQQEKYAAMKAIKDEYYSAKRAAAEYEHQAYKARQEKKKAEREAYEASKRRAVADQKLEEASQLAYSDEIITAEGLIRYFDKSALPAKEASGPSKFAATAQRTVNDSGMKGTRLMRKDEEDDNYFIGTGGKKGKKNRKAQAAPAAASTPAEGKYNLSIGVIDQLNKIKMDPPMNQADVPNVVAKLKEKLDFWKEDQDRKTKENVTKAKKEIERLESESAGTDERSKDIGNKPSAANQGISKKVSAEAELQQEKDAEADVAEELEKAKIEDGRA